MAEQTWKLADSAGEWSVWWREAEKGITVARAMGGGPTCVAPDLAGTGGTFATKKETLN